MFTGMFHKIDKIICMYLGLEDHDIEQPKSIKFSKNKLILYKNHLFKRHRYQEIMEQIDYTSIYPEELNQKIALAAGKAIAKNLTISYEKVEIKRCQ